MKNGNGSMAKIGICCATFCLLTGCEYAFLSRRLQETSSIRIGLMSFFYVLFLYLLGSVLFSLVMRKFNLALRFCLYFILAYIIYAIGIIPSSSVLHEKSAGKTAQPINR